MVPPLHARRPVRLLLLSGLAATWIAALFVGVASCSSTTDQRIGVNAPAFSQDDFSPFGDFLIHRCGTLDCHGQVGRNLSIFGCYGMRLNSNQSSNCAPDDAGGGPTTLAEYQATYRSLVGLEPQLMSAVYAGCKGQVSDGGADYPPPPSCHPEVLTFIEKARGVEAHKGGKLVCLNAPCPPGIPNPNPYDPQDVCMVSWLEGRTSLPQCTQALNIPAFGDASAE